MNEAVQVVSPSRLHFGLLSFGRQDGRQFGGVGVMINSPSVNICLSKGSKFQSAGTWRGRIEPIVRQWGRYKQAGHMPACRIHVDKVPLPHVGLGSGTQLALAVSRGLDELFGFPFAEPADLAASVGRGLRSAVGTYGFVYGGLVAERGKLAGEMLAPIDRRIELPATWRFVLVRLWQSPGLSGNSEAKAFQTILPVPHSVTGQLEEELNERLLPAAAAENLADFGESVYQYGRLAGGCFSQFQSGPFATKRIEQLVDRIRHFGVKGVGQSSWGPTVFAVTADDDHARALGDQIRTWYGSEIADLRITSGNNTGARVTPAATVPFVVGA